MTATLHKLSAGDGYLYLVRQVAAADATERGRSSLADYYSAKGEAPGRWVGRGLSALAHTGAREVSDAALQEVWSVATGSTVTEDQMKALFGEGLHPNADRILTYVAGRGLTGRAAIEATRLGRKFHVREGEPEFTRRVAIAYRAHLAEAGQHWNDPIDAETRALIRTQIARDLFREQYGRPVADDRELSGFIARNIRARTTAVAGYDFTCSPVKSVSALWAVAPQSVAAVIEECHHAAVAEALGWLEENATYTRTGTNGIAQVDTEGLIGAEFTHRDARAGDPDLHTHVAISNKVCHIDANGVRRWLALDGQPLHRVVVAASELYNSRLEAHLEARLGVRFAPVKKGQGKRPVREIIGVSAELISRWSSRRKAIEARTAELSKQFQAAHGREPTNVEAIALAQQATLETREAKHEPRSLAEQRHTWRAQAIDTLGHAGLTRMLADALTPTRAQDRPAVTDQWIADTAAAVITTVSEQRATWQYHHVRAEALRKVRAHGHAGTPGLAEAITDAALSDGLSVPHAQVPDEELGEPTQLRRRDGASVYSRHGVQLYTSSTVLAAERRILAAAQMTGGRCTTDDDVELALADSAARGRTLNAGQATLVAEMATCGRRVALALAPAGTGKTVAMGALSHAWRASGGTVIGLAPTADAAIVLGEDLNATTDTLHKYVHLSNQPPRDSHAATQSWYDNVGPNTLIVVDESGKADTATLDAMISDAIAKGASVRLIGDDGQLSSVSAGGVLRDIAEATDALTLSEVVRFHSPAEAAAGLALHAGDPAGIGFYIDNHRIHVGADETAADMAYSAWRTDLASGRDSLLLAPTNDIVDALNARARLDRLAADPRSTTGPIVVLADNMQAGVGDTIRTRRNARWLPIGRNDFVRNGYRYQITELLSDGSVRARHLRSGRIVTLPAKYLATHVTLGYAATIDSAQGLTADSCHIVGADHLSRQMIYVALTRGRADNHMYLSTAEADPHRVLTPKATHPDTAVDVLTRVLAHDGAQVSATTAARQAADPATRLAAAADMYYDALGVAAEDLLGEHARDRLDAVGEAVLTGLSQREAWPVLRRNLAVLAISGADPRTVLTEALAQGSVADAHDPAAILDWRIDPTGAHSAGVGPLRWLPTIPQALLDHTQWGPYLARRERLVAALADGLRERARNWTNATAPAWARPLHTVNSTLTAEIAVFRAAVRVDDADTRLTGPTQYPTATRAVQSALQRHAAAGIGRGAATTRWNDLMDSIDSRIRADSYWPQLADHLAQAAQTRDDLRPLVTAAAAQGPLPDELPAAALWWRLAGALSPTATLATTHSRLRPAWTSQLHVVFGPAVAEIIVSGPAWPSLVAAISAADPAKWTPLDLLRLAAEQLAEHDPDHRIPTGDYARLITYTVDMFTHRLDVQFGVGEVPLPDEAPLSPEEHEELPPDPHDDQHIPPAVLDEGLDVPDDIGAPPDPTDPGYPDDFEGLRFEDLPTTRPSLDVDSLMQSISALRDEYQSLSESIAELSADIAAERSPAVRAAAADIVRMRALADADRPYRLALAALLDQWSDADAAYNDQLRLVEHAQARLTDLEATRGADPLDIDSARADLRFHMSWLPDPPAQRFQAALADLQRERELAADGADNIVTDNDIIARQGVAEKEDRDALAALKAQRQQVQRQLDRAERDAARAFAEATTTTMACLDELLPAARIELDLLAAAGRSAKDAAVHLSADALADLSPAGAHQVRALAALPYSVAAVSARLDDDAMDALAALKAAANANDRKVLWLTPEPPRPQGTALADTIATIQRANEQIQDGTWSLPTGTIVIVDDAPDCRPDDIGVLVEHANARGARVILLDTPTDAPAERPAASLLRLLSTTLPGSGALGSYQATLRAPHPRSDAALTQAGRFNPEALSPEWHHIVTEYTATVANIDRIHRRHLLAQWPQRDQDQGIGHSIDE